MVYQLDVMANSVADAVGRAGGVICDRALAGWEVRVFSTARCDPRPLAILGAASGTGEAPDDPRRPWTQPGPRVLVMPMDKVAPNGRVRGHLQQSLAGRHVDVLLWGQDSPVELTDLLEPIRHDLSAAARAFKAQAALAAGLSVPAKGHEEFWAAPGIIDQLQPVSPLGGRLVFSAE